MQLMALQTHTTETLNGFDVSTVESLPDTTEFSEFDDATFLWL